MFPSVRSLIGLIFVCVPLTALTAGCRERQPLGQSASRSDGPSKSVSVNSGKTVSSQGRIQPKEGIIRLSALPGDRVESIDVAIGAHVVEHQELIHLESASARALELKVAQSKLNEGLQTRDLKQREAQSTLKTAELNLTRSQQQLSQAKASLKQAQSERENLSMMRSQVDALRRLREDKITHAAVGMIELKDKEMDLTRANIKLEQAQLNGTQTIELAGLQVAQAEELVANAKAGVEAAQSAAAIETLTKQIELLQNQIEQSKITSPINGTVLSVNTAVGERTAQVPLIEVADLSNIVCVAEVHESDVSRIKVGNKAEMKSSALRQTLVGTVQRIDRVVGNTQLRSPNPLSRSDFRSVQVWIDISGSQATEAANLIQLQVDVSIALDE